MKFPTFHRQHGIAGRSPQGECGLKYVGQLHGLLVAGRSPQGECGLKYERVRTKQYPQTRRSPQGECGLKSQHAMGAHVGRNVAPRKGSVD